jgi:hypothetical protein
VAELTLEHEQEIRALLVVRGGFYTKQTEDDIRSLLAEITRLRERPLTDPAVVLPSAEALLREAHVGRVALLLSGDSQVDSFSPGFVPNSVEKHSLLDAYAAMVSHHSKSRKGGRRG